ncbi:somatostatin receptor type 5-like [Ptychodera flava]|uniref:somatostatin receptor type 5-like n=1 Tax=Ptychodera flava TaxID=63121 RepID=UPI00396A2BB8
MNNTTNTTSLDPLPPWLSDLFMPIISSLVCVLGLLGNGIVIYTCLRYPGMSSVPNLYIVNLAVADFLHLFALPFLIYFNTHARWVFGNAMCKVVMGLDGANMFTGIFTLTAMAVDRYLAIVHIVWAKNYRTQMKTKLVCCILWMMSLAFSAPLWLYANTMRIDGVVVCIVICPVLVEQLFIMYTFVIGFVSPLVIITVCYVGILRFLGNNARRRRRFRVGHVGALVLMAVLLFVVCWLPFWIVRFLILSSYQPTYGLKIAYYIGWILITMNSCLNPLVYAYFKHDFRDVIWYCCLKCKSPGEALPRIRTSSY